MNRSLLSIVLHVSLVLSIAVFPAVALAADGGAAQSQEPPKAGGPSHLDLTPDDVPKTGIQGLHSVRARAIGYLMKTVQDKQSPAFLRQEAIKQLGEWRADEAAGLLVQEIDFWEPLYASGKGPFGSYPAAGALAKIGPVAFPKIVSDLCDFPPQSEERLKVYSWIVYSWDGHELGVQRLELARAHLQGESRDRISRLIDIYKSIDFTDSQDLPQRR